MWSFVITDLQGAVQGELTNADERKVTDPWLRIPTASCNIPLWHPMANTVMGTDTLLKCYRKSDITGVKRLAFCGPVVTAEEVGQSGQQSIGITAQGPFARLQNRLLGRTKSGISYTNTELGQIARNILTEANGLDYTGISLGTYTTTGINASTGTWWLKPASEAIAEIGGGLNSFEWRVRPTEPTSGLAWPRIGLFDVAPETSFSVLRPDAVYEYGTPRANVSEYRRKVSRETMLNRAFISVQGWPDSPAKSGTVVQDLIQRQDLPSLAARGLFEAVVPDGGVIDSTLRTKIADFHLAVRKNPRQQITFTPAPNSRPVPYDDYGVGEQIRARAVVRGVVRFDAVFRVWGLTFNIDKNGNERIELELIEP